MNKTRRTKQEKGITLVALIITIIVLLILAVVAIRAVQGDGILQHAKNAKSATTEAQEQEQILLAVNEWKIQKNYQNEPGSFKSFMIDKLSDVATIPDSDPDAGPLTLTMNDTSNKYIVTDDGTIDEPITISEAQSDSMLSKTKNSTLFDVNGNKVIVPAGFKILIDDTKGYTNTDINVTKGIVITDGTSEFVWVPTTADIVAYGLNSSSNREPDVVTGNGSQYDAGTLFLSKVLEEEYASQQTAESFKKQLTAEFNSMKTSVNKYHGFYVGRYETSLNGTTAQSKSGEPPMNNINWYAMYTNSKTYAPENSNKSVVSQMIWGSQWNAMMNFIGDTAANSTTNVGHGSSDFISGPYQTGGTNYTEVYKGTKAKEYKDKAANIYDLEGNVSEWTQEAFDTGYRVFMGGSYNSTGSPNSRSYVGPGRSYSSYGSRLALYIK